MKQISIIIPNVNSLLIHNILQALENQTIDTSVYEVLIIGIDEPGLVKENKTVRFIETPPGTYASNNRNRGMEEAQGDIFLFIDHDCIPAPDLLERHWRRHQQGEAVVGGAIKFGTQNYYQLADNVSAFHDLLDFMPEGPVPYLATSNLSVDRSVVTKAGKMPAQRNRAEDLEWTVQFREIGYRLYFDPQAVVFHDPPRKDIKTVWQHWVVDAHDTLKVRLKYAHLLDTPTLAKYRWIYLLGSPGVAAWATVRTFAHPRAFSQYWHTLPLVYLTKLAWCWGAFKNFPNV